MNKTEYAKIVAHVTGLWPNNRWEMGTIRAGESLLLDLDARWTHAAVELLAAEGERFAPNPGQIRKASLELAGRENGSGLPDPDAALEEVYKAISHVGYYRSPEWSHDAIGAAVDAFGGWQAVCLADNPEAFRAHFMRLYASCAGRRRREQLAPASVKELVTAGLNLSLERAESPNALPEAKS